MPAPGSPITDGARVEALVVGSGYGGAVTALRLTRAGITTHLVEMGRDWGTGTGTFSRTSGPDHRSTWFSDRTEQPISHFMGLDVNRDISRFAGILHADSYAAMKVYQGRGLGGGSLVNGGMAVQPSPSYLQEILPGVDTEEMYETYFPRAGAALGVNDVDPDWLETTEWFEFARVGRRQAHRSGFRTSLVPSVYDWSYMEREDAGTVPGSALDSQVLYGNDHGKRSLDKTYLASAMATGRLSVSALHEVTDIRPAGGGYEVTIRQITDTGEVVATKRVTATKVFLAAGSVGTSALLVRQRALGNLPDLPDGVGTGWGNNGNVMVARANGPHDPTGPKQSTIPAVGIENWDDPGGRSFIEIAPIPTGFETHIQFYLAITDNPHRATFAYDPATDGVTLSWQESWSRPSIDAARRVLDTINEHEGTTYRSDLFGEDKTWGDDFTYHPLGGCLLDSATDNVGRLPGHPGLYVMDGALIPGCTSVNPFLTITALAERNIERIIASDFV